MKTYECTYQHNGENASTAYSVMGLSSKISVNFSEKKQAFIMADSDQQIEVYKYLTFDVKIPDWMDINDWIKNYYSYSSCMFEMKSARKTLNFDKHVSYPVFKFIESYTQKDLRLETTKLLFGTSKSPFKSSLKKYILDWIDIPDDARKYDFPLSHGQIINLCSYSKDNGKTNEKFYDNSKNNPITGIMEF